MTNGDRIRSMTNKELAAWVAGKILGLEDIRFAVSAEYWNLFFQLEEDEE